ncbi:hypothetical protein PC129_g3495 [Phytophthora cactorum]|uniref:DDE Tnp4 domain-containing protein n=1 Tax=Phytophthora cactorum TaxID=29920 RepID=A0A8T0ZSL9_9STRA|nr:hypothetical protein PC112_g14499 [Phytophthora cactorum]KAG2815683.1 hypothetical protein PC111_g13461 [Phytophthora cactorum]KAG2865999.1 hypothetical protein PC113_g3225 [Phytophthora cactorum]KAG2921244.1 hypothetical protein PC114_g5742 [Phytophthora cactorum]KAG2927627.1 hypothetical protein PC115_g7469 [Phytophthora cactorum]
MEAADVVARLRLLQSEEHENLERSAATFGDYADYVEEEVLETESPVMDSFVLQGGNWVLKTLTNFTQAEFGVLWAEVEGALHAVWSMVRGRRSQTSAKDAMFKTLVILKHYDTWDKHAVDFGLKPNTLEKMTYKLLEVIEPIPFAKFVKPVTMTQQRENNKAFRNYPYALYATDVKFQPAYRQSGHFTEKKTYFSGKHKLYGYKLECSVGYPGVAVDVSSHEPGSKSDLTMMLDRRTVCMERLLKTPQELGQDDNGEGAVQHPLAWGVLVDKGYQGAEAVLRTIQLKRKPRDGELSHQDMTRNRLVSSDRVLVENYFGRVCMLWKVMYTTYKWGEVRYDMIARACFALTNFHVSFMPLRNEDNKLYHSVLSRYQSMAEDTRERRKRSQKTYMMRRDRCLPHRFSPLQCTKTTKRRCR